MLLFHVPYGNDESEQFFLLIRCIKPPNLPSVVLVHCLHCAGMLFGGFEWGENVKMVGQIYSMGAMVRGPPPANKTAVHIFRPTSYRMSESDIETYRMSKTILKHIGCRKALLKHIGCRKAILKHIGCRKAILKHIGCRKAILKHY